MREQDKRWHTNSKLWEQLKPIAHEKREQPTEAEKKLWKYLRKHQVYGLSFRRQHCIGQFIVDFYCKKTKLVIEVDGPIHQYHLEEDKVRQEYLEGLGLKVLRFSNDLVINNIVKVMELIKNSMPGTL